MKFLTSTNLCVGTKDARASERFIEILLLLFVGVETNLALDPIWFVHVVAYVALLRHK